MMKNSVWKKPVKTYKEEFDIMSLNQLNDNVASIKAYRHETFIKTDKYKEVAYRVQELLAKVGNDEIVDEIIDSINDMETVCFDQGYEDGMADLMTAITLNQSGITDAECVNA